ncbi:MAG: tryptophan--tRNA ligase [Candidatus Brocadiales bacterium]|nr:tryptophan--tRNA ligase [Candidatus Bathyanammoxibius amoris]
MKKRLFSGIQPTGEVHIGNYLGAIKNWVKLLDKYDCIFSIVDYHAITVEHNPDDMSKKILQVATADIAAGLDPERCTMFVQSHVPEHVELAWILNTVTPIGHLERMTQFKDKAQQQRENVNAGLFVYPILQAADILLYKAEVVPVGEDQLQHLELSREIVRKFNRRYGNIFPEPKELLSDAPRIMGLDAANKMSKSMNNYIGITESPEAIWKKLSVAVTDPARIKRSDPGTPEICNIYHLHKYFSSDEEIDWAADGCRTAGIGCLECKKVLSDNIIRELAPMRQKAKELDNDPGYVLNVLKRGAERCRELAHTTMKEVRSSMGLNLSVYPKQSKT